MLRLRFVPTRTDQTILDLPSAWVWGSLAWVYVYPGMDKFCVD